MVLGEAASEIPARTSASVATAVPLCAPALTLTFVPCAVISSLGHTHRDVAARMVPVVVNPIDVTGTASECYGMSL